MGRCRSSPPPSEPPPGYPDQVAVVDVRRAGPGRRGDGVGQRPVDAHAPQRRHRRPQHLAVQRVGQTAARGGRRSGRRPAGPRRRGRRGRRPTTGRRCACRAARRPSYQLQGPPLQRVLEPGQADLDQLGQAGAGDQRPGEPPQPVGLGERPRPRWRRAPAPAGRGRCPRSGPELAAGGPVDRAEDGGDQVVDVRLRSAAPGRVRRARPVLPELEHRVRHRLAGPDGHGDERLGARRPSWWTTAAEGVVERGGRRRR